MEDPLGLERIQVMQKVSCRHLQTFEDREGDDVALQSWKLHGVLPDGSGCMNERRLVAHPISRLVVPFELRRHPLTIGLEVYLVRFENGCVDNLFSVLLLDISNPFFVFKFTSPVFLSNMFQYVWNNQW